MVSDAEYTELQSILQGLEPKIDQLGQSSQNFVRDQISREKRWRQDIFLSPRQWQWLRDLYTEHCPSGRVAQPMSEQEAEPDIDDEITF